MEYANRCTIAGMFEELRTAIDELDIPADGPALTAILALRDRLDAHISQAVATHDHTGLWELDGATSMTAWLTDRAAMPRARAAAATVARARKVAHLPVTAAAWSPVAGQWTAANFKEVMPGVVTPLTASFGLEDNFPRATSDFTAATLHPSTFAVSRSERSS